MPGYAVSRSTPVVAFFRLDDEVMTFGLTEHATVRATPGSTLRPCVWYLDDVDEATLEQIADIVRMAFNE